MYLKLMRWAFLLAFAVGSSILLESIAFTLPGNAELQFHLFSESEYLQWIIKHLLIGAGMFAMLVSIDSIAKRYPSIRNEKSQNLVTIIIIILIIVAAEAIGYKGVPFCGFNTLDGLGCVVAVPLVFGGTACIACCLVAFGFILYKSRYTVLRILTGFLVSLFIGYSLWRPVYQQLLEKKIPLYFVYHRHEDFASEAPQPLRDALQTFDNTHILFDIYDRYQTSAVGQLVALRSEQRENIIASYYQKDIAPADWTLLCNQWYASSLGMHLYGASIAGYCQSLYTANQRSAAELKQQEQDLEEKNKL